MVDRYNNWADYAAKKVMAEKGNKDSYVCAAGITPSGTVHIGNFREIMTVELVVRALRDQGKKVRFIYSWDDYDVFRKVPKNMPRQEYLQSQLRKPIVDVEDPFGEHESYARHHEIAVETDVARVGIKPEYIYQSKMYRALTYVEGMKTAMQNRDKIRADLDKHRKEPLKDSWLPISGYCPECNCDEVTFSDYDEEYTLKMSCTSCGAEIEADMRKSPFLKLPWRVDWPMRWAHEQVDFEPGGKDHSTPGGSYDTGKEIVSIYNWTAPTYIMYDFVIPKGAGGKMSSSTGNVTTLRDGLEIYQPEMIRWFFAGTRPQTEFSISFDLDVLKNYEDFDKCERFFFDAETANEKEVAKQKRIYELSCIDGVPEQLPIQPSIRHMTNFLQINELDIDKTVECYRDQIRDEFDEARVRARAECARNWLEKYAPEDFRFSVNSETPQLDLTNTQKECLHAAADILNEKVWTDSDLHEAFYNMFKEKGLTPKEFFGACYGVLISKTKGPQLASFIINIGQERVAKLFGGVQ